MEKGKLPTGSTIEWLNRAKADLTLAAVKRSGNIVYEDLCYHAQQALEKAIKAVLIFYNIRFP